MKIAVGMSGGVDSAVSAFLLKQQGNDVIGITMKLLNNKETNKSIKDAENICNKIGIKFYVLDLVKEFKDTVIKDFIDNYKNGYTPNPCVLCNKYFKFGKLYEYAKSLGYDYIATGHYVDIKDNMLCKCDNNKDQSYFLYQINKDVIDKIVFPLREFKSKDEIREIAIKNDLIVGNKKDSQEICFIPDDDYVNFLTDYIKDKSGNIVLKTGQILGKHNGLYKYTIGQRKGLNISYKSPLYVLDLDIKNNNVIVGSNEDLFKTKLIADNVNLFENFKEIDCLAKVRSRGNYVNCHAVYENDKLIVTFTEPVRAITKGQSVVLYKDNTCLGGGIIKEVE